MKRGSSHVPSPPGEPDSTQRLVHIPATGLRPLPPPTSPEMTGRIYLPGSEPALESALTPPTTDEGEATGGSTVSFSLAAVELQVDPRVSASVEYTLDREIARGGMGKIFAAHDSELDRSVALKISSLRDRSADGQFIREAKVLAHLSHPNIVPIHNIGVDSSGRPFYSMKLVNGRTLHSILRRLDAGDAQVRADFGLPVLLSIFRKVCDAVAYAHSRGYLHRDLKPDNVMVGEFGEVMVMDWGLAKIIRGKRVAGMKEVGVEEEPETLPYVEGTPQYMSPEQAEGVYGGLDERSDVYSLGGILHAILTKRPPFSGTSVEEVLRQVRQGGITTLSASGPVERRGSVPSLGAEVPDALRAVTLMAMARERAARYQSVAALEADIDAYQSGYATIAEQANLLRVAVLFVRRHRAVSIAAFIALALFAAGAVGFVLRVDQSKRRAQMSALRAWRASRIAEASERRADANAAEAREQAQRAALSEKAARAEKESARRSNTDALIALTEAAERSLNPEGMQDALAAVPEDLRDQRWRYLKNRLDSSERTIEAPGGASWRQCVAHPRSPGVLITAQDDNWIRSIDLNSGEVRDLFKLNGSFANNSLALSPDGQMLAALHINRAPDFGPSINEVRVFDLKTGKQIASFSVPSGALAFKFNADGSLLWTKSDKGWIAVYDVATETKLWSRVKSQFESHFDGVFSTKGTLQLATNKFFWEVNERTGVDQGPQVSLQPLAFAQAVLGQFSLFLTSSSKVVRMVDPASGRSIYDIKLPARPLALEHMPAERLLIDLFQVSEHWAALEVRDAPSGTLLGWIPVGIDTPFRGGSTDWRVVVHHGSRHVCVFRAGVMKVWSLGRVSSFELLGAHGTRIGQTLATCGIVFLDNSERVCNVADVQSGQNLLEVVQRDPSGAWVNTPHDADPRAAGIWLSANRSATAIAQLTKYLEGDYMLKVFRATDGKMDQISSVPFPARSGDGGFLPSPRGDKVWSHNGFYSAMDGTLLCDLKRSNVERLRFDGRGHLAWTDNSHVVELATEYDAQKIPNRALLLWDEAKGQFLSQPAPNARSLCVSPDGLALAEGGEDGKLRIRNAKTLELIRTRRVHDAAVTRAAWHPTLSYVATSAEDFTLKVWDIHSGVLVTEYRYMPEAVTHLDWSPDGQSLLAVWRDRGHDRAHLFRLSLCPPAP